MSFAAKTGIPVDQTCSEIEGALKRYGADRFAYFSEADPAIIVFEAHDRRIRFDLPLPAGESEKEAQLRRQRWRVLLLCIKVKLESVQAGIESFEAAFLAHVVMPDGRTVADHTLPTIAQINKAGEVRPLLPPARRARRADVDNA